MRTRYGISPWIHRYPDAKRPNFPRARGAVTADVVVIGGGLTGCATARACAGAGFTTVVLEAGRIGQGSSGRSAGLLLPEPGPRFQEVVAAHGLRSARRAFELWDEAATDARALLRKARISCGLEARGMLVAAWAGDEQGLRREHDARQAAGLDVSWLAQPQALRQTKLDVVAAMRTGRGFAVDPYRACIGLAATGAPRRLRVFERSSVSKITTGRTGVEIATAVATITAGTVVVTTGSATAEFSALRRHFKAREDYLVLTEPLTDLMRKGVLPRGISVGDTATPSHRVEWTADHRILIRGAAQDATPERLRAAVRIQRTGQLMYEFLTMSPSISGLRPEYGWELSWGRTADGLMYIGPHRNYPRHLFALGGGSDSIAGAFLSASILLRALQGSADKADALFSWAR
jgi:glycine/D-amino acid oxidase-like deaminating enzyme